MRALLVVSLALGFVGCQFGREYVSSVEQPADPSDVTYVVVHGWPVLPEGRILGQATGVGVDSHNHVFVFHRAGREWSDPLPDDPIEDSTVAMFDGDTGELLAEWGSDLFAMPHGLTVDDQDNIWVTDVGVHQVFKLTHDGHPLMTVGTGEMGSDERHFALPTDVAVLPDGSFYVSDGYGNTRVVKFSAAGEFLFQWGTPGSGPGELDLPHGIALDREGRVYVADRSNARVQVFDPQGQFLAQWQSVTLGRPYAVAIGADGKAYVIDGGDQPAHPPDRSQAFRLTLDGTIEARFGRYGNYDGQFQLGHDIAVAEDEAVYVVDAWGMRVQKFVGERAPAAVDR
jgi:peptidylamidoglycolate lyase